MKAKGNHKEQLRTHDENKGLSFLVSIFLIFLFCITVMFNTTGIVGQVEEYKDIQETWHPSRGQSRVFFLNFTWIVFPKHFGFV